jgi:hypothetical protein
MQKARYVVVLCKPAASRRGVSRVDLCLELDGKYVGLYIMHRRSFLCTSGQKQPIRVGGRLCNRLGRALFFPNLDSRSIAQHCGLVLYALYLA